MESRLFLDTHCIIWLAEGKSEMFSPLGVDLLNKHLLCISPIVRLELHFLYDKNRFFEQPDITINSLAEKINLKVDQLGFSQVIGEASQIKWTRDVFDLFITAQSQFHNSPLLTKDRNIRANYQKAIW
ncbi:MAG: PIN domain-containing protein [Bacteroidia bacterium]|nr:PIN domain-containing protein [Bacteroidia bacterium]